MLPLLTFGCAEEAGDVRGLGTRSPEAVWFELSLIGHVTSRGQFSSSVKPETRIG